MNLNMDWIQFFINNGVPMVILGFILWYFVKPIGDAFVKNINKQTEVMDEMLQELKDFNKEQQIHKESLKSISEKIDSLIKAAK